MTRWAAMSWTDIAPQFLDDDPQSYPAAMWREIAGHIAQRVQRGLLRPGERLPSYAALAVAFGVSVHTIRRAVVDLECRGILLRSHGKGTFVSAAVMTPRFRLALVNSSPGNLSLEPQAPLTKPCAEIRGRLLGADIFTLTADVSQWNWSPFHSEGDLTGLLGPELAAGMTQSVVVGGSSSPTLRITVETIDTRDSRRLVVAGVFDARFVCVETRTNALRIAANG